MRPLLRHVWRPRVSGLENVPSDGPVILASNHLSFIDSIVIPLTAPRRVRFLAKSEYFEGRGARGLVSRLFFTAIGAVAVRRSAGAGAQAALDRGREVLEEGDVFAVYPEGTRSRDGRLYRGRTGVAWLALTTGARVVPVGLVGTADIQPVGARIPRLRRISVSFGEPLDLSGHGPATSGAARRAATDQVMRAIRELSGQESAGCYNVRAETVVSGS
jgi:1-acyl-sn-glycerol-3-phosphate acyltransferase